MSMFGWSMPAGCSGTPYDETHADDITKLVALPAGITGVFWDEDGNLIESFPVTVPADEFAGLPEYTESQEAIVGTHDWNDDLDEDANRQAAAHAYNALKASAP